MHTISPFSSLLGLLLCIPALGESLDRASYQHELHQSKNKIQSLDKELKLDNQKRDSLEARLNHRNQNIYTLNKKITSLEQKITKSGKLLKKLEANLVVQRRETQSKKHTLAKQMRFAYQMGVGSDIELLLNQNSPAEFDRVRVYSEYFSRAGQEHILSAVFSMRKLAESRLRAAKIRKYLKANRQELESTKKRENIELFSRKQLLAQLNREIGTKESKLSQLKKSIVKLQELVLQLDRRARLSLQSEFSGKGDLPWPVQGKIKARYGQTKFSGKLKWNGLFLATNENSEVRAIAAGEVVYADWLNGFGMLLIIDHGKGVMSLYGNNRDLLADIGNTIKKGQLIATVGNSSGQLETGLYFEIRENAVAVDPQKWITQETHFVKTSLIQAQ